MFQFRFAPLFQAQKEQLIRLRRPPEMGIPPSSTHYAGFELPARGITTGCLWRAVLGVVRPLLFKVVGIFFLSSVASALATVLAMQILESTESLKVMGGAAVLYFLMNSLGHFAIYRGGLLRVWVGSTVEAYLAEKVARKILALSSAAAVRQSSGNLKVLVTSDVKNVGQFLDHSVRFLIPSLTALVVVGPLLIRWGGRAGAWGLLIMVMILPISLGLNRVSTYFQDKTQKEMDSLTALVGEWLKNIRLIRYLSWDHSFESEISGRLRRLMKMTVIQHFMVCLLFGLSVPWWMVSITGVILISRFFQVQMDLTHFFGSLWLFSFLAGYFLHLPSIIRLYGLAQPSMGRIARFLSEEEQQDAFLEEGHVRRDQRPTRLIFDQVSFSYPDGKEVIRDFSMELDLSRKVAVIGAVGSGKTTLLKLILGEYFPSKGRILVEFEDGLVGDLRTHSVWRCLRSQLAGVPQDPFVSNDLFSTNLALQEEFDAHQAWQAAEWAELEADLRVFPQGMEQELGEGGVNLSGGQRQRLNLARAWYSQRPYLVLDDPLSAVDVKTEVALMERLAAFSGGWILVSHRTAELMRVEEVIVMKEGRWVERGTPSELVRAPESQFSQVLRAYESEECNHG